jgi:hypothetical protein
MCRERNVEEVITYYHIELASLSLIVAENTPAETFVDNVERARFDNYAEYLELYPEEAAIPEMDLPVAMSSRQFPASTRRRLNLRASALYGSPLAAVA